jgi:hypothetical protein
MPISHFDILNHSISTWLIFGKIPAFLFLVSLYFLGLARGWSRQNSLFCMGAFCAGLSIGTWFLPSILGAFGGALLAWILSAKYLKLTHLPYYGIAWGLVALLSIGRIGCLMNGCCFGTLTDLPWAIHYLPHSFAYQLHSQMGWINTGASQSLGVHPYPLYESLGLVLWMCILPILKKVVKNEFSLLLSTIAFDLFLRAGIEGTRAMINVWWALIGNWLGLNLFQWALLGSATLILGIFIWYDNRQFSQKVVNQKDTPQTLPEQTLLGRRALLWGILWGSTWISAENQTPFLHLLSLLMCLACALTLNLPNLAFFPKLKPWMGPTFACSLIIPLVTLSHADELSIQKDSAITVPKSWVYQVQGDSGVLVRVGSTTTDSSQIQALQKRLKLESPARTSELWLGAGTGAHSVSYESQGCGGPTYVLTKQGYFAHASATAKLPVGEESWTNNGINTAFIHSNNSKVYDSLPNNSELQNRYWTESYIYINPWTNFYSRYVTIGGGLSYLKKSDLQDAILLPGAQLVLGHPFASVDIGAYDQKFSYGAIPFHIGISGRNHRVPGQETHTYFVGVLSNGADNAGLGALASVRVNPNLWWTGSLTILEGATIATQLQFRITP